MHNLKFVKVLYMTFQMPFRLWQNIPLLIFGGKINYVEHFQYVHVSYTQFQLLNCPCDSFPFCLRYQHSQTVKTCSKDHIQ